MASGAALCVKGNVVGQHHHVDVGRQGGFQLGKPLPVLGSEDIIGVQPQAILLGGFGKGKVPGLGKVLHPGKGVHLGAQVLGPLYRGVLAAGVHHNDLVHQPLDGLQAPGQGVLLIFNDHAQADGDQKTPPFPGKFQIGLNGRL